MTQRPLRILTIAPKGEPRGPSLIEQGIVPIGRGGAIAAGTLTPERIGELQALLYSPPAEREPYTPIAPAARTQVMRSRLLSMAARPGATSLILAGRLLRDHGDDARAELHRTWTPEWGVKRSAVDNLLSRAGVML